MNPAFIAENGTIWIDDDITFGVVITTFITPQGVTRCAALTKTRVEPLSETEVRST